MVDPDFSEFQFAYGMTRELDAGKWPLAPEGVPFFPTQRQETDLGFDVGLRSGDGLWPLFIQYKRSKKLTTARAIDEQWKTYQEPFFRFKVETSDDPGNPDQHGQLVDLGKKFRHTYYVAPEFIAWSDYERYARQEFLNEHAAFLRCGTAPTRFDSETHYICHRPQDAFGLFFSESPSDTELEVIRRYDTLFESMQKTGPAYESFQGLRGAFTEARTMIIEERDLEIDPREHTADELMAWMREQQRFFYETLGTALSFLTNRAQ
jgi:hypothetical protein